MSNLSAAWWSCNRAVAMAVPVPLEEKELGMAVQQLAKIRREGCPVDFRGVADHEVREGPSHGFNIPYLLALPN